MTKEGGGREEKKKVKSQIVGNGRKGEKEGESSPLTVEQNPAAPPDDNMVQFQNWRSISHGTGGGTKYKTSIRRKSHPPRVWLR